MESVRQCVSTGSRYLLTRGTSGPDAISPGIRTRIEPDDAAGDNARSHGLFSSSGRRSDVRPADGRAGCELSDKQRRERGPLKPSRA